MNITIYSTTTCVACEQLTRWLTEQKFSYTKKITDDDPAALEDFLQVNDGLIGVPFSVITAPDGTITKIMGYDQAKFRAALHLA